MSQYRPYLIRNLSSEWYLRYWSYHFRAQIWETWPYINELVFQEFAVLNHIRTDY